jgi:hypothetical protein
MRVVLDTNVYVSALTFPGGRGEGALRLAIEGRVEVLVSPAIVLERPEAAVRSWPRALRLQQLGERRGLPAGESRADGSCAPNAQQRPRTGHLRP